MSAATRRELKEIEASLEAAETEYQSVSDRLRLVQQERANTEEELRSQNSRLKAMLDEIATRKVREGAADAAGKSEEQAETRMTMAELNRRVLDVMRARDGEDATLPSLEVNLLFSAKALVLV